MNIKKYKIKYKKRNYKVFVFNNIILLNDLNKKEIRKYTTISLKNIKINFNGIIIIKDKIGFYYLNNNLYYNRKDMKQSYNKLLFDRSFENHLND